MLDLGQRDAGHGRQVAGHERQHAGRHERDEADRERGDDGGVDAASSPVEGRQLGVEPARVVGVELGGRRRGAGALVRRHRRASSETPSAASATSAPGTSHAVRSKPLLSGTASTSGPYSSTSAALISSFVIPSAIRSRMNARSWSATGACEMFSAVRHSTHITSSSTSGSVVFGSRRRGEREQQHEREQDPHARSFSSGSRCSSSQAWSIGPRRSAAIRPLRSIRNVSG